MKQFIIIVLSFLVTSCASQNDDFYRFYEPQWKPKKVVAVETPAKETKVEETKEQPEERPTIIVRAHKLNPVYQGIQFLDYTEKEDRRELKELTGVDPVRIEWCAAFANAILEKSDIPSNKDHKYALTARAFLDWGKKVEEPEMGDIVVFPRGNQGWQGHVGFYVKQQEIDGVLYYYILGGNQNNKVSVELFRADKAIGIRRYEEPNPSTDSTTSE
jgi:uncharacterized protein (TIGR02594 family)